MSIDKLRAFHEEILQEEEVKVSELPTAIQGKIRGFNLMRKKLEKNPNDEKLLFQLQKQAVRLGDEVQSFIENDYEDDKDDEDDEENVVNEKDVEKTKNSSQLFPSKKSDNNSTSSESRNNNQNKSSKTNTATDGNFGNSMMEKKIMSIMQSRGDKRIKISDLEAIIGKEPSYPEQKINNIKLRKVFLSNDYRLV